MTRPSLYSFLLALAAVIAGTILAATGHDAQPLWLIASAGGGAGAMAAAPPASRLP